jgi:hypothetical protein
MRSRLARSPRAPRQEIRSTGRLFALDIGVANGLAVFVVSFAHKRREIRAASAHRVEALIGKPGLDFGEPQRRSGATMPNQLSTSKPGKPDSSKVGTSGSGAIRLRVAAASARSLPAFKCSATTA